LDPLDQSVQLLPWAQLDRQPWMQVQLAQSILAVLQAQQILGLQLHP